MPSSGGKRIPWTARDTEWQRKRRDREYLLPKLLVRLRRDPRVLALYRELEIRDLIESETTRIDGLAQSWTLDQVTR